MEKSDNLAHKIRASAKNDKEIEEQLATSQRIFARVTDGIYREPWAAFRELIANAYDADAKNVTVETGAPNFDEIVVRDDGNGMSPETLAYVLHNIGGSSKRTKIGEQLHTTGRHSVDSSPEGRPLIGKIGIGLFAVAQLTQHFQIITKAAGETIRTSATVLLKTHDEEKLRKTDDEKGYIAGQVRIKSESVPSNEKNAHGTTIVLYSLRPEVRRTLQSLKRWQAARSEGVDGAPVRKEPDFHIGLNKRLLSKSDKGVKANLPWKATDSPDERFARLVTAAADDSQRGTKPANLEHFDDYLRLIWQLSLSLPLAYIDHHPFDFDSDSGLRFYNVPTGKGQAGDIHLKKKETLRDHFDFSAGSGASEENFSVVVDGISIRRPIRLPLELKRRGRHKSPILMTAKVQAPWSDDQFEASGGPLSFEAYLYWNNKIVPKDNAGVLVRIREASGTLFDRTFLNYQVSEQNRLSQITAEIFVQDGLDSAINIDRESFNYSHPHFLYLQLWLHKALRLLVNRVKRQAADDLALERGRAETQKQEILQTKALGVWTKRQGDTADPPLQKQSALVAPSEVGNVEIEWAAGEVRNRPEQATALAVVLEAYDALSHLSARDRAKLINDIIQLFEE